MAQDPVTGELLVGVFTDHTGQPCWFYRSPPAGTNFTPADTRPGVIDHDTIGLMRSYDGQWIDFQGHIETRTTPKLFPDCGTRPDTKCYGRRVMSTRVSATGSTWTEPHSVRLADDQDPPQKEFCKQLQHLISVTCARGYTRTPEIY